MTEQPGLFGINKSNRDFNDKDTWGKNQFNSSFPAALCCYLDSKDLPANYLSLAGNKRFAVQSITIDDVFGISPKSDNIFFAFESSYVPYERYITGNIPRTDLVILEASSGASLRALEVKLTALPDNTTCDLTDSKYGCEIVVRPDTIVYLACSIIESDLIDLEKDLNFKKISISDWSDPSQLLRHIDIISNSIENIAVKTAEHQAPFLLQPIWKTKGKSPYLADNCLDVFVWSTSGFFWFISQICCSDTKAKRISRHTRTAIWLYKMLFDYCIDGHFDHEKIIDELSYTTKNDKAFASSGYVTNPYMTCPNLTLPRIQKAEIKNIILGGGQNLLSPERRFDAIVHNSPELFEE